MKFIKILLSICLLLLIVVVLAAALLNYFVDPNQLKPILAEQIKKQTGSNLVIDGNLSWAFYPRFGIEIPHMTLTAEGKAAPFADLHTIKIAASLSQLWKNHTQLKGNVYIEDAIFMHLHSKDIKLQMHWANGLLTLQPINSSLYAGSLTGMIQINPAAANLSWRWNLQLKDVQLAPLLTDLNGSEKITLTGTAQINLIGNTMGKTRNELLSHLNGTSQFTVTNGTITGIDLNYFVQTADALFNKKPISLNSTNETTFQSFVGTLTVVNGVAQSQDLLLTSPAFTTQGSGTLSLLDQSIDLQLQVKPQQTLNTQWQVPVVISGSLDNPKIALDTSSINKLLTQQQIKKVTKHVEEQVKKHISDKASKFLQQLLGE